MMHKKLPEFVISKDNITYYLIFLFFYSLLFINIFTPFKGAWYNVGDVDRLRLFTDTIIICTGGIVVMLASRTIMYNLNKRWKLTYFGFIIWQIFEMLIIAILYALICHYVEFDTRNILNIFLGAIVYVPLIMSIPALISILFFFNLDKKEKIEELSEFIDEKEKDEFILDNHITPIKPENQQNHLDINQEVSDKEKNQIFNFFDERGELQISLKINNIYYIESAENYINIYYNNKDQIERFTIRSTLKKQFEKLEKYGFIRCHRSFVVNFNNISILRKEKDGSYLDFDVPGLSIIPISKTYIDSVTQYFIKNS